MQIFKDIHSLPEFKNAVITIGTFDGVHMAHREIIRQLNTFSKEVDGESVIITFYPHPRNVIDPEKPVYVLNTLSEKIELLQNLQVDNIVIVPFSREFSEMEAGDYINTFLIAKFNPKTIVFGYDHKYGKNRKGDIHLLREIASHKHIRVAEISEQEIHSITVSSTKIRSALLTGDIGTANALLGYNYALTGVVVKGDQIGRELGYPTANVHMDDTNKLIPADGVYAVRASVKGKNHDALMSIGMRPTFNGRERRLEVNILDFKEDIYGEALRVEFIEFIRKEQKFNSREELIKAMDGDKKNAYKIFALL